jgi:ribosomal protein L31E
MPLDTHIEVQGFTLTAVEQRRIDHDLAVLARQGLAHRPAPKAVLVLRQHVAQRQVEANLQVQLGPLGAHVVSHQAAETADRAVRLAVADIERQLERRLASQRGEPSYGVPSRREPAALRPHPLRQPAPAPSEIVAKDDQDTAVE